AAQRRRDDQPRRVRERARLLREAGGAIDVEPLVPQALSLLEVEAEEVAAIVGHNVILMAVAMLRSQPRRIRRATAALSSSVRSSLTSEGPPITQWGGGGCMRERDTA